MTEETILDALCQMGAKTDRPCLELATTTDVYGAVPLCAAHGKVSALSRESDSFHAVEELLTKALEKLECWRDSGGAADQIVREALAKAREEIAHLDGEMD